MSISDERLVTVFNGPAGSEALTIKGVLNTNGFPHRLPDSKIGTELGRCFISRYASASTSWPMFDA